MGNDPVNNVDPDGGSIIDMMGRLFAPTSANVPLLSSSWGTSGSTTASGSSGSLGGSIANGVGNAAAYYLGKKIADALFPLPQGPDARNLQSCSGGSSGSSGAPPTMQQPSTSSEKVVNSPGNDCKCPPGYSTTPKSPTDQPYFFDADDAARNWAYEAWPLYIHSTVEYASQIFSIDVPNSKTTLFGTTSFARNPPTDDPLHDPTIKSPPPYSSLHGKIPDGARIVGHIHLHYYLSRFADYWNKNRSFSPGDKGLFKTSPNLIFYVFGALGELHGRYPDNFSMSPEESNSSSGGRAGETDRIVPPGIIGPTRPEACRCYKK